MSALARLREDMKNAMRTWMSTPASGGEMVDMTDVVDTLTGGWWVEMKRSPSTRERHYVITTPSRPPSGIERLMDEARAARDDWVYSRADESVPPPMSVTMPDLLNQRVWWITGDKQAVRLDDMTPSHRVNLLAHLRRRAPGLQME